MAVDRLWGGGDNRRVMMFTLHRYIFRELLRVFLLSALALTVMVSLGSIIRPVQEYGVGPGQVMHFMVYFLPITLTFVLPMAALFASALVYGRFAADNELDACRASGISLMSLVYPGLVLAVMVAIANLVLSFYVMPAFVQRAEESLKADAKQIFFRNIQRRGYYELPPEKKYLVYADYADPAEGVLSGVVVAEREGMRIGRTTAVERAKVNFISHSKYNEVQIIMENAMHLDAEGGRWVTVGFWAVAPRFGSLLADNIKFKNIREMKEIQAAPLKFFPIAEAARKAYAQFAAELLAKEIGGATGAEGGAREYELWKPGTLLRLAAGECAASEDATVELSRDVTVREYERRTGELLRTWRCRKATLGLEGNEFDPMVTMTLRQPEREVAGGKKDLPQRHIFHGLMLPESVGRHIVEDIERIYRAEDVEAALGGEPSARLASLQSELRRQVDKAIAGIEAEIHFRLVFGLGCVTLIMISIGLGIIKRGGHLLSAFGASCVPATGLLVCLLMGKNMAKHPGVEVTAGTMIMWAGLAGLTVLTVALYRRLLRN